MTTLFLELDDEITSAVGRLRAASDPSVALVLPAGSRIASSRINFRLLAREAEQLGTQLSIVSPEATARALASAAGLPTFGTVNRYEAAMAAGIVAAGESGIDGTAGGSEAAGGRAGAGFAPPYELDMAGEGTVPQGAADGARRDLPVAHGRRRFVLPSVRGGTIVAALVILAILGAGTAAGAYFILPEARITVTPRVDAFEPLVFHVSADPAVTTSDAAAGVVPATLLETTVDVQDSYKATGVKVTETKAAGNVTFSNLSTTNNTSIPKGAVVKTRSGTAFVTDKALTVPHGTGMQDPNDPTKLIITPGTASVGITASKAGTAGNVAARTITVIPKGYNPNFIKVTNPNATSGGTHTETKVIRQSDYDAAVAAAQEALHQSFDQWATAPTGGAGGAIVVAESAVLDDATFDPAADQVVGKEMDTFDLAASADGRVVTVDPAVLTAAGEARFRASQIPAGSVLVDSSLRVTNIQVESDDPAKPMFEITANGQGYRQLDAAALEALVLGKPVDEAVAILRPYGDPVVALNPDWFGTIPQLDWRVTVDVSPPVGVS